MLEVLWTALAALTLHGGTAVAAGAEPPGPPTVHRAWVQLPDTVTLTLQIVLERARSAEAGLRCQRRFEMSRFRRVKCPTLEDQAWGGQSSCRVARRVRDGAGSRLGWMSWASSVCRRIR